jgi:hypothetical protein
LLFFVIFDKVVEDDGEIYIAFKNGSRMNEAFIMKINEKDPTDKYMAEIENTQNIWKFNERWVGREEEKWEQDRVVEILKK